MITQIDFQQAALELARRVVAYDEELKKCANDPEKMSSHRTVTGESLDELYLDMVESARRLECPGTPGS